MSIFTIQIEARLVRQILAGIENAFIRFCFEKNHDVALRLDTPVKTTELYPDIVQARVSLPDLPKRIRDRAAAKMTFPEVMLSVEISPNIGQLDGVDIRFHTFGTTHEEVRGDAAAIEVTASIEAFVADLRERIVAVGYLTREQTDGYVRVSPQMRSWLSGPPLRHLTSALCPCPRGRRRNACAWSSSRS